MVHFDSDYMAGALPEVLAKLVETNLEETTGYGSDAYTRRAKEAIKRALGQGCGTAEAGAKGQQGCTVSSDVYFLVGGTQTNKAVIDTLLGLSDGVLAAESGHINVHESGAIEATGHKVLTLPSYDGKVKAEDVNDYLTSFYADASNAHMVAPGALYISFPTELGTIYTKAELTAISEVCRKWSIPLFMDGARLGYGLVAEGNDVTLKDLTELVDVFYIGGTKQGLLFGEAVVVNHRNCKAGAAGTAGASADCIAAKFRKFTTITKMHGGLLAKGRLLGVQFETLFTGDLYERSSRNAVRLAMKLRHAFEAKGFVPFIDSPTNQQFFTLPNTLIDRLMQSATFEYWGPRGESESRVRFVCSWATTDAAVNELIGLL